MIRPLVFFIIIYSVSVFSQSNMGFGSFDMVQDGPCLTEEARLHIQSEIDKSVVALTKSGKLSPATPGAITLLSWPVRQASNFNDYGVHGISNFVDQESAFPNQLQDYNCGTRTYDLESGYNHRGTDVFTWPFGWTKMDEDAVEIVAAAPGTIILKQDGNPDRNCNFNNGNWNAVYVQHADGSIAWYGHMKTNSLTEKIVGESVIEGEYLGVIGSSGSSTGPHLHFEVYDGNSNLVDPYTGSCNSMNNETWWANQLPYYDSAVNALITHSAAPQFQACPTPATINASNNFQPGETVYYATYYRDQLDTQTSTYTVFNPDGSTYQTWSHNSNAAHYNASYWYWSYTLPANAQQGTYTFQVEFNGQVYTHDFQVGTAVGIEDVPQTQTSGFALFANYPNPFNPSTTIRYALPVSGAVDLTIFDQQGREVAKLVREKQSAGHQEIVWNGLNQAGEAVSSGIYFYRLQSGSFSETRQMMLVQ